MKRLLLTLLLVTAVAVPALAHPRRGHGRGPWKHRPGPAVYYAPRAAWCDSDLRYLRGFYGPRRFAPIPAGYRLTPGRPLHPALLRRMQPIPVYVERRLAPLPYGYSRGFLGGNVVIWNRHSSIALDIASLF
jgi:hypothetical protein